ncbi:MAG TPA: hypothetical protein VJC15_01705 [Candidatus Paceibacterota bacterium]
MTFEIIKQERETNQSLIRRFTKRLRDSGILVGVKKSVFHQREKSKQVQRHLTLRKLEKRKEYERAYKLGEKNETRGPKRN